MSLSEKVDQEIKSYEDNVQSFLTGKITPEAFQRIRLQNGVYGQRQDGVQMIRIKIPMGIVNATQIECIAELAETIAHNNAHITTRQDLQIHYVDVKNTPALIRKLESIGLTTREACGNTVRNVTASPSAGVDPGEAFDVTPYAQAMMEHLLRNPICQNLPRKFKIAFDGGGVMTAYPMLHDLGLVAKIQNGKRGFEVFVGGGLGSSPRIAKLLDPFMDAAELIPWAQAVIRVFDRLGERKVRSKARMKFVIDKVGFEEFKRLVAQERSELEVDPTWNDYLNHLEEWDEKPPVVDETKIPPLPKGLGDFEGEAPSGSAGGGGDASPYNDWKKTNVWEQKQKGYSMVEIRLTTGDMSPSQMRTLADISRRYCGENIRLMVHQNILIRWVRNQDLPAIYQELKAINFVKKMRRRSMILRLVLEQTRVV
ncbi:MAG: nitrite/sulfite reductase [Deltaproteobacteria bacterium]|nr:MAG: nitrite/sulfite reductase [Deltaproteobacteria bacterium]